MIRRILFPTDFSPHAQKCVNFILQLKDCGVDEVILLHVVDTRILRYTEEIFESALSEDQLLEECRETCAKNLAETESVFQKAGIKTRSLLRMGVPFSVILKTAEEVDASLIVLGHRGHNLAEELLLGSVAEKVLRKSKRPVLLVR